MSYDIPVIPKPVKVIPSDGVFQLTPSVCINSQHESMRIGYFLRDHIKQAVGIELKVEDEQNAHSQCSEIKITTENTLSSLGGEGYRLSVTPDTVVLIAATQAGLFYGIQTLVQLIHQDTKLIPSVEIVDWPRFHWRGIMLDVGRHIFPVEFIKRLLDVMAMHKLNVFHWHLTEDQGWRIEIKKYPKLTEIGAFRSGSPMLAAREQLDGNFYGGYYTQGQIVEIVKYATDRFITIVPEIEMPGHSVAALASYPNLGCSGGPYHVRTFWGIADDVFCAGNDQVFSFLQGVLDEVLSLFPSEFIHIGGDECPKTRWALCPKCQDVIHRMGLKNEHELQSYFIKRIETYLNKEGRRLIGWDEILEGGLAPNATVMSWRGIQGGIQAVKDGHDVVMTPTSHCYFDYYQSDVKENEPPAIGGFLPLEKVYEFDPVPPDFTDDEARHILGAQGNLWTEYVPTQDHAGYMLFPRATALAEVVWSPKTERDFIAFNERLHMLLPHLSKWGMNYRP